MHTTEELREKIKKTGWVLHERPIRTGGPDSGNVRAWKMIVVKGDQSLTLESTTLEDAMIRVAYAVGVLR